MTLTKQDLVDWKNNPVTMEISKALNDQVELIRLESPIRDTCDQTAMQAAQNQGQIDGLDLMNEAYEALLEGASE